MSNPTTINGGPLQGMIAATFTPLFDDGTINTARMPEIVEHLLAHSVSGMYVLGSTGEGLSLTVEERRQAAEAFVQAAKDRLPVIVQVGSECLLQAKQLAAHAQQIGADAISAVSPVYFKPDSLDTLIASMAEIAAGAPNLPFYYYHIPGATGVDYSMLDFLRLAPARISNLAGIKYTSTDVEHYQACVEFAGKDLQVLWGVDEMLFDGLSAGAQAAVGSTYNYMAPVHRKLLTSFADGELEAARAQQRFVQQVVDTFVPFGHRAAQKAIMNMVGPDCGPCRLPVMTLPADRQSSLHAALEKIGFFDAATRSDAQLSA